MFEEKDLGINNERSIKIFKLAWSTFSWRPLISQIDSSVSKRFAFVCLAIRTLRCQTLTWRISTFYIAIIFVQAVTMSNKLFDENVSTYLWSCIQTCSRLYLYKKKNGVYMQIYRPCLLFVENLKLILIRNTMQKAQGKLANVNLNRSDLD